ncbi:MAG: hypothetical protein AAGI13_02105 [Pseudomonadota bacterium]
MTRLIAALLALTLTAHATAEERPSNAALTFVAAFSDAHLANMLSRFGQRSPVLGSFAQVDAQLTAEALDAAIADAIAEHGAAWRENMATAWMPLLSEAEFISLTNAGAQSPHLEKYLDLRDEAGAAMQASSEALFSEILRDVIDSSVAALTPADPDASQTETGEN